MYGDIALHEVVSMMFESKCGCAVRMSGREIIGKLLMELAFEENRASNDNYVLM